MYSILTNRIRALKSNVGKLIPGSPLLHNFNVHVLECGNLGTMLVCMHKCQQIVKLVDVYDNKMFRMKCQKFTFCIYVIYLMEVTCTYTVDTGQRCGYQTHLVDMSPHKHH